MHPRSRQWHQLDLVITKRELFNSIHITRTYHSADCDTDHSLVLNKITLSPKRLHYAKPKGLPKINTGHTNDAERIKHFTSSFKSNFHNNWSTDATTKWNNLRHMDDPDKMISQFSNLERTTLWLKKTGPLLHLAYR